MVKSLCYFLIGILLGGSVVWGLQHANPGKGGAPVASPDRSEKDIAELNALRAHVARLEAERDATRTAPVAPTTRVVSQPKGEAHEEELHGADSADGQDESVSWRISAIEKFVPLSSEQKDRLREKYADERKARADGAEVKTESLDEILGAESATYYREQVQAAFKRVQDEEVEREVAWLSRKLTLSPAQESAVQGVLARVEESVRLQNSEGHEGATPQERVKNMVAQNRRRTELRNEELKKILSPDQYRAYLESEAQSSAADMEVFHDPGASGGGEAKVAER